MATSSTEANLQSPSGSTNDHSRTQTRFAQEIAVGIAVALGVWFLHDVNLLVSWLTVPILVAVFVYGPGPKRFSDRTILYFVAFFGWLALLGWLPKAGTAFDLSGFLLGLAAGAVVTYQVRHRGPSGRSVNRPFLGDVFAIVLSVFTMMYWLFPFRLFQTSGVLGVLLQYWDNISHFYMFRQNLQRGSFIEVQSNSPRGTRLFRDYPQGLHQSWSQLVHLWYRHPGTSLDWLLRTYEHLLVLTAGAIVLLGCMAVSRVCGKNLFAAVPGMAVIAALFITGTYGPFTSFMNWEFAVIGAAIAITLVIRPTLSPLSNFFVVAGLGLIATYNWYPLMLLSAPAILLVTFRAFSAARRGRQRNLFIGTILFLGVAFILPFTYFAHAGIGVLLLTGGPPVSEWGMVTLAIALLLSVVIVRQSLDPNGWVNAALGAPALLGAVGIFALAIYETKSTGSIQYYGLKFGAAVFAICLVVLACVLTSDLAHSGIRQKLSRIALTVGVVLFSFTLLQLNGYVGFYNPGLSASYAPGLSLHRYLYLAPDQVLDAQRITIAAKQNAKSEGNWYYIDPTPSSGINPTLLGMWFFALRGNATDEDFGKLGQPLSQFSTGNSPDQDAQIILQTFADPLRNHFHVIVPAWLYDAVAHADPSWVTNGALIKQPLSDS